MDSWTWIATFGGETSGRTVAVVVASLAALVLAFALSRLRLVWQVPMSALLLLVSIPLAGHAEHALGNKDDHAIVIDEVASFPVAILGLPIKRYPLLLPIAFAGSWVLDGIKPPPAPTAERLPGGFGIMLDDVIANLYMLGLGHLLLAAWRRTARRRGRPS